MTGRMTVTSSCSPLRRIIRVSNAVWAATRRHPGAASSVPAGRWAAVVADGVSFAVIAGAVP